MNKTVFFLVLVILTNISAYSQDYNPENDFNIEIINNGREISIIGYTGSSNLVNIPPVIQGLPVSTIESNAFSYNTSLRSITIPASITSIGDRSFSVSNITEINVAPDNPSYTSLDGVLFDKEQRTLIKFPGGKHGHYTIPDSVTTLANEAFSWSGLRSVTIPTSVTSIGFYAFAYTILSSVIIPNSIIAIPGGAFQGCTSLTSVTIPDNVTSIGWSAFDGCTSLSNIIIPNSITTIEERAFYGTILIEITIPVSVNSIGEAAFAYTNLTSVTFGGKNTIIAFLNRQRENVFPGDLRARYLEGRAGTYTRDPEGEEWRKVTSFQDQLTIILDPGHGGRDTGAVASFTMNGQEIILRESVINLTIAKMIKQELNIIYPNLTILLTREEDEHRTLEDRVILANSTPMGLRNNTIFISLHVSSSFDHNNRGIEISLATDTSINSPASIIAESINLSFINMLGEIIPSRGILRENPYYFSMLNIPFLTINMGFISNVEDRHLLYLYPEYFAAAIVHGISSYIENESTLLSFLAF